MLIEWKSKYKPKSPDEEWHPYFMEALQNLDQVEYQLDTILPGNLSDRAFLIKDCERKVTEIEERIRKYRSDDKHLSEKLLAELVWQIHLAIRYLGV